MEAWVCVIQLTLGRVTIEMQNEDAMILAMKSLSKVEQIGVMCINQFDGRVFWFRNGQQVERT